MHAVAPRRIGRASIPVVGRRRVVLANVADKHFALGAVEMYPTQLCDILARAIVNAIRKKDSESLWAIIGSCG